MFWQVIVTFTALINFPSKFTFFANMLFATGTSDLKTKWRIVTITVTFYSCRQRITSSAPW